MKRKHKGIRRKRGGWQTYVRIHGQYYSESWPLTTPLDDMREWIADQKDKHGGERAAAAGSLAADVATYLERVAAMPTIKQRTAHLELWLKALGRDRPRRSITADEIDVILQGWLQTLAPGTVRKRRTALQSFFVKMDGKKARRANPVKGSENPRPPKPEARGLDYATIARAIAAMPDTVSVKKGAVKRQSLAKIRARVIAYTGIPPGLLQTITANDLSLSARTVRVRPRRKGSGVEARTLPLTEAGLKAFTDFHAANAYGPFAVESLNRSFKRGCARAGLDPGSVTLYDLRHSFLSQVYRVTRDLATVGRLGLHADGSTVTARYAKGANQEVDAAAVAAFSAALEGRKLPGKVARKRKPRKRKHLRRAS
jgi:integrase